MPTTDAETANAGAPAGTNSTAEIDENIEALLEEAFEENYELLRLDTGQALSPSAKRNAFHQVLLYWKKLEALARRITDTEVKLTLPVQESPGGRTFGVEGVVDIVKEDGFTVMYDVKTHDASYVRENRAYYEKQLNVYAHIWQTLRGRALDRTAVIATSLPESMKRAVSAGDPDHIDYELQKWNPLVEISCDERDVEETIEDFGRTVDAIEDGAFRPPPPERLSERQGRAIFATRVCGNCDARFSCTSFRAYAAGSSRRKDVNFREQFLQTPTSDADQDEWLTANLDATPTFAGEQDEA